MARLEEDMNELKQSIPEISKNMASLLQTRQPIIGEQPNPNSGRPQGEEERANRPNRREREEGNFKFQQQFGERHERFR